MSSLRLLQSSRTLLRALPRQPLVRRQLHSQATVESELLARQRRARPIAPHLSIYQPQITWYLSSLTRITGFTLSGGFYLYFLAYLVGPYAGIHVESLNIAKKVKEMNNGVKVAVKAYLGGNFAFHCLNGVRHLTWDTGSMFSNAAVKRSGWVVVALTAISTGYLTWL